jgi:hypothetical protein
VGDQQLNGSWGWLGTKSSASGQWMCVTGGTSPTPLIPCNHPNVICGPALCS